MAKRGTGRAWGRGSKDACLGTWDMARGNEIREAGTRDRGRGDVRLGTRVI